MEFAPGKEKIINCHEQRKRKVEKAHQNKTSLMISEFKINAGLLWFKGAEWNYVVAFSGHF